MGFLTIMKKQKIKDKEIKCLLLGLDNSGKSTIVKGLQDITCETTTTTTAKEITPTVGFSIKSVTYSSYLINIWDIGGQKSLRPFWNNYFDKIDCLLWCVDIYDKSRINESMEALKRNLESVEIEGDIVIPVIILLNKVDLIDTMTDGNNNNNNNYGNTDFLSTYSFLEKEMVGNSKNNNYTIIQCSGITHLGLKELLVNIIIGK
ncbi:Arf family GTPase CIN4 SCDLUD_002640 [Saccharomycodes ludwigii]|uniref:Arf family GTPase CIN4 n=1 Tax=Saccharomycodes ludwigii TaxID=36035 RepID=UPI001E8BD8A8|nr:hypothetical protein SCDLUD_002640 [Saccharomycodes ludwigii]KAH3901157.1 hypothetical protein SCDLUD_002640 [Saccharomycodes ludwigii]